MLGMHTVMVSDGSGRGLRVAHAGPVVARLHPDRLPVRRRAAVGIPRRTSSGFTLFEVAISLVLLAFGVISIMVMFPVGLRAQQLSRFQLYAAAKAEELVTILNTVHPNNACMDTEGLNDWDVSVGYRTFAWDLESRVANERFGMMPLPLAIARRLDSDNDEIKTILDQGGQIYYSQPLASNQMDQFAQENFNPPNEAQRLLIGITGYAQQNAIHIWGKKNWPYFAPYPSPPQYGQHMVYKYASGRSYDWLPVATATFAAMNYPTGYTYCYEGVPIANPTTPGKVVAVDGTDPDIDKVFCYYDATTMTGPTRGWYGYYPYALGGSYSGGKINSTNLQGTLSGIGPKGVSLPNPNAGLPPSREGAVAYVAAALWYAAAKGNANSLWWGGPMQSNAPPPLGFITKYNAAAPLASIQMQANEVRSARFLAHALACLSSWYATTKVPPDTQDLSTGVTIPMVTWPTQALVGSVSGSAVPSRSVSSPAIKIYQQDIDFWHERAIALGIKFCAAYPYAWSVPRPLDTLVMNAFPLLQYDLFSPPLTGFVHGGPGCTYDSYGNATGGEWPTCQWRPLAPQPIVGLGVSWSYPNASAVGGSFQPAMDPTMVAGSTSPLFGNLDHYNLGAPFAASERCREIVFWAADWQSYTDFETAPSVPPDASRYPIAGPLCNGSSFKVFSDNGASGGNGRNSNDRMGGYPFSVTEYWTLRNPEISMILIPTNGQDPRLLPTGSNLYTYEVGNEYSPKPGYNPQYPFDWGSSLPARQAFSGVLGADRNYNQRLDRGTLLPSVRMHAIQVARFNYYDPRLECLVR